MIEPAVSALLWLSALSCAVMAGLYFAFGEIDRAAGIAAMIAINRDILRSAFMPVFLGSTLASFALAVIALLDWGDAGAAAMLTGAVIYVLRMFGVTMAFNVPLNNRLIAAGDDRTWALYLTVWTRWNHVRTAASLAGPALFVVALIER